MTDTTQPTENKTIPQRATAALPLPPMPEHDAYADMTGGERAQTTQERGNAADVALTAIAAAGDDHIDQADPYKDIETQAPGSFVRQPFGEARLKLQAPPRPGFRRYWFNDVPGRVPEALRAGYSFVKEGGRNIRNVVGRARNGNAQVAYLMEIPMDWFAQDIRRQQAKVDDIDAAIKGGQLGSEPGKLTKDGDNRYVPKDAIKYDPRRSSRDD